MSTLLLSFLFADTPKAFALKTTLDSFEASVKPLYPTDRNFLFSLLRRLATGPEPSLAHGLTPRTWTLCGKVLLSIFALFTVAGFILYVRTVVEGVQLIFTQNNSFHIAALLAVAHLVCVVGAPCFSAWESCTNGESLEKFKYGAVTQGPLRMSRTEGLFEASQTVPLSELRCFRPVRRFEVDEYVGERLRKDSFSYGIEVVSSRGSIVLGLVADMQSCAEIADTFNRILATFRLNGMDPGPSPQVLLHREFLRRELSTGVFIRLGDCSSLSSALSGDSLLNIQRQPLAFECILYPLPWPRKAFYLSGLLATYLCAVDYTAVLKILPYRFWLSFNPLSILVLLMKIVALVCYLLVCLEERWVFEGEVFSFWIQDGFRTRRKKTIRVSDISSASMIRFGSETVESLKSRRMCGTTTISGRRYELRFNSEAGEKICAMGLLTEGEALAIAYEIRRQYPLLFRRNVSEESE